MGTKIQRESYFPGFNSMRDLNEDSSSSSWPLFNGEKNAPNAPYCNGSGPGSGPGPIIDGYGCDKDALKQKMIEHETVFKNQVYELHRLYGIQKDMMEEAKKKELNKKRASMDEPSSSSTLHASQIPSNDAPKRIFGVEIVDSPMSCTKGYNSHLPFKNGSNSKDLEMESRPLKVRKTLFDLEIPADEEGENVREFKGYDLNVPIEIEEEMAPSITENKFNGRGKLSHMYEAGSSKSNLGSTTGQGFHQPMVSQVPPTVQNQKNWWSGPRPGIESSVKNNHYSNNGSSYPFFSSSSFANSWAQSISTWANPKGPFGSSKDSPILRNSHPYAPSQEPSGRNWLEGSSSRLNPGSGIEVKNPNGFYNVSGSGSKFSFLDRIRGDIKVGSNHRIENDSKGFFNSNSKPGIDINLNESGSKSPPNDPVEKTKPKDNNFSALPSWLKSKPSDQASSSQLCRNNEGIQDLNVLFGSSDCEIIEEKEARNVKKIFGFPVDAKTEGKTNSAGDKRKNVMIDMNVAFEPDDSPGGEDPKRVNLIDLNSIFEDLPETSEETKIVDSKEKFEIDLEAPIILEDETILPDESLENKKEQLCDEILAHVTDAIFDMSSSTPKITSTEDYVYLPSEASAADSLLLFADSMSKDLPDEEEMDEFEAMTLQLTDLKEEEYTPKPFIPEFEEMGPGPLPTRARRGPARRGRQRRDFQRDILPGLTSLSRHEVTEDVQTFTGLMRATGHNWSSGSARRKGGGRGRKRAGPENGSTREAAPVRAPLIEQLSGIEDRSLTGWGKTTRRPRRQRGPHGGGNNNSNNNGVVLI